MTRNFLLTILLVFFSYCVYAQQLDSTAQPIKDTSAVIIKHPARKIKDTIKRVADTALVKSADTSRLQADSLKAFTTRSIKSYYTVVDSLLLANKFINVKQPAVYFISKQRQRQGKEFIFYSLCIVLFIFGLFKTFYSSYFNNLFRVFFNTSIRQTQLTDQLLQSRLPSFILNIFFAVSTGFYLWLLFKNYHPPRLINSQLLLPFCIAGVGALYFVKFCVLKFIGWMSGTQAATDNYIFVIFLVNKVTGVILIPFIILLAFAIPIWTNYVVIFSLLTIGLFFLSRYIKAYSVLEYRFPLEPLHFIIYVAAVEVLPLLLLYKLLVDYVI